VQQRLWGAQRRAEALRLRLEQLSPLAVLARGYAIVQDRQGRALRSATAVSAGDPLRIRLHEGSLQAIVSETTAEAAGSKE
jgi:exodeoxyribonuclease VII large subunit